MAKIRSRARKRSAEARKKKGEKPPAVSRKPSRGRTRPVKRTSVTAKKTRKGSKKARPPLRPFVVIWTARKRPYFFQYEVVVKARTAAEAQIEAESQVRYKTKDDPRVIGFLASNKVGVSREVSPKDKRGRFLRKGEVGRGLWRWKRDEKSKTKEAELKRGRAPSAGTR